MAADLNAIKKSYRLRAEIAVGATVSTPKYEAQIGWLQARFQEIFDGNEAASGAESANMSMEGSTYSVVHRGATPEEVAGIIESLIRELQALIDGATQTMAPHGMRWSTRMCES